MSLRQRFGNLKMDRKLIISFLVLVTIPLIGIGYYSSTQYEQAIKQKTIEYSMIIQESNMVRIDDYIKDMVSISSMPVYIDDLINNLVRSNDYYMDKQENYLDQTNTENFSYLLSIQRSIENELNFINTIKRGENSVYLFDTYGNSYYSIEAGDIRANLRDSYTNWMSQLEESKGEAVLFPTERYVSQFQSDKFAFTVVRKIMNRNLNQLGLIAIDAKISVIEVLMRELDEVTKGTSMIVNSDGHVIYSSKDHMVIARQTEDAHIVNEAKLSKGSFITNDGTEQLHIYSSSKESDWKVITSIPIEQLTIQAIVVKRIIWITTAVAVLLSLAIATIVSYKITKPLRIMAKLMRRVQEGNFKVKFPVKYQDEVGLLGNQFNRMIVRLDELIQHIYDMEKKKNSAELQALQNQINPHFMYNTLETIRMNAEVNDDDTTADMIATLGKLLRYSISELHTRTMLYEEIEHVQNYINLLNYRYPNRFTLVYSGDEELSRIPVIRLMLQPIVENAIYHGLDDNKEKMNISLSYQENQTNFEIFIADDGTGIDEAQLAQLNLKLASEIMPSHENRQLGGIGLKNVNDRVKLQYGEMYGIQVQSKLGMGTKVCILLPKQGGNTIV